MDLASQGGIPLGARNMDEHDSSRVRSLAPNRPARISCMTDEGKVSIPPCIAHASGYGSSCKIADIAGFVLGAAIFEGVRLQFKGEKREHLTQENFRSVILQVPVANEDCVTTVTPFSFFFLVEKIRGI
jgi:hypothetical protein